MTGGGEGDVCALGEGLVGLGDPPVLVHALDRIVAIASAELDHLRECLTSGWYEPQFVVVPCSRRLREDAIAAAATSATPMPTPSAIGHELVAAGGAELPSKAAAIEWAIRFGDVVKVKRKVER